MEWNLSNWERGIRIGIGVGLFSVGLFAGLQSMISWKITK
jgi:hypothetical protein